MRLGRGQVGGQLPVTTALSARGEIYERARLRGGMLLRALSVQACLVRLCCHVDGD